VFKIADHLVGETYRRTQRFPDSERFALQSQVRRAAVSVASNIVEGCARPSKKDYMHFLSIALGSASEARYLVNVAGRLGFIAPEDASELEAQYDGLVRGLQSLVSALDSSGQ